jgi:hypothetical protein
VAGAVRRGYLKGLGQQRGCSYPARPAFARVAVTGADLVAWDKDAAPPHLQAPPQPRPDAEPSGQVTFVSEPVVQESPRSPQGRDRK